MQRIKLLFIVISICSMMFNSFPLSALVSELSRAGTCQTNCLLS